MRQCATAAWPPRAALAQRLKAAVGTARPDSAAVASPSPPAPDSAAPPDRRLVRATVIPTARAPTAAVRSRVARTAAGRLAAPVVVSAPVSRRPRRLPCAGAEPPPAHRATPPLSHAPPGRAAALARGPLALRRPRPAQRAQAAVAWQWAAPALRTRVVPAWPLAAPRAVRLGRARIRPSAPG
jgi:hypothetical protein